jgi:hypothetical protein
MTITDNYYENLRKIPVREHFDKKGNLDYLAWSKAWDFLKRHHPSAEYWVVRNEKDNLNYFTNNNSGWVTVVVSIGGLDHSVDLAIMDNRNKAISKDEITSVDVMNTIQRATVKACAMHGLGINAWTGEKDYISDADFDKMIEANDYNLAIKTYNNFQLTAEQKNRLSTKFKKQKS